MSTMTCIGTGLDTSGNMEGSASSGKSVTLRTVVSAGRDVVVDIGASWRAASRMSIAKCSCRSSI